MIEGLKGDLKPLEGLNELSFLDFDHIQIKLASPETILSWSHGEVTRPDTINYRTQKPERDGLFCERIFGPVKDYECSCGRYKRPKYKGTICDRCGVEVTSSSVRRERMGHIDLAVPVAHVFYYKIPPSKIGLLLDLTIEKLEAVLNFELWIVIDPGTSPYRKYDLLPDEEHQYAVEKYEGFRAGMGAEAIKELLTELDLDKLSTELRVLLQKEEISSRKLALLKKLKVVEAFRLSGNRPEWMILTRLPVIPPDLRPLVSLEGGRYATSDLNDLYKRVITRNNRLKNLLAIKTPEVILRNEKRMLQDAVDALFDNARRRRPIRGRGNRPLKSLADSLRGKQGRFRRNLLGKRVDYSGRSVIVVGPELKLHQCGLPKEMALELFRPIVMRKLEEKGFVESEKQARGLVKMGSSEVFETLEEITKHHPVLLNRAPTLHRVSIQAFEPVLIEGRAIAIHPLVCVPYNADFDGDTMSVHVPLSPEAITETYMLMFSINNIRSPAHGGPLTTPTQDMVIGIHYLTKEVPGEPVKSFASHEEVLYALDQGVVKLHTPIRYYFGKKIITTTPGRVIFNQILPEGMRFRNECFDKKSLANLISECLNRYGTMRTVEMLDELKKLGFDYATTSGLTIGIDDMIVPKEKDKIWREAQIEVDKYNKAARAGILTETERYNKVIDTWHLATVAIEDRLMEILSKDKNGFNPIHMMVTSGARGSSLQAAQISGLRGLMSRPQRRLTGQEIIETPIKSSCKEGLSVLEYFISTHGQRKGLADTALKTADAGYLTRRLVDVAQNIIITMEDCGTILGRPITTLKEGEKVIEPLSTRIRGRVALEDIVDPVSGEVIVKANEEITDEAALEIENLGIERVMVRSVLTCEAPSGICARCYGRNLATGRMVEIGEAVGIIAAQSIGEPGTQLTLKTFHGGGAAARIAETTQKQATISGKVKFENLKSVVRKDGTTIALNASGRLVLSSDSRKYHYNIPLGARIFVKEGGEVQVGDTVFEWDPYSTPIICSKEGRVKYHNVIQGVTMREDYVDEFSERKQRVIVEDRKRSVFPWVHILDERGKVIERFSLPTGAYLMVKEGDRVEPGDLIAKIPEDITKSKDITGGLPRVEELFECKRVKDPAIISEIDGVVQIREEKDYWEVKVIPETGESKTYKIPYTKYLKVTENQMVKAGDPLCGGSIDPHDILRVKGTMAVMEFLVNEIKEVYRIQDVKIDDKHFEVIVRQMLQRVKIEDPGGTAFVAGEIVDKRALMRENEKAVAEGRKPATYHNILLGITRASLSTDSFFSAASFQETTRVLSEAAMEGKIDYLEGLKENVLVGKLIPAGTGLRRYQYLELVEEEKKTEAEAV
ncbi:DNA-directed RNA polymerase subunit beta' [candidate division WOR-3 bacterium]|uniref:DNA-directed RNA polymerase subunit beta' n=1 Tax=candidate division WOR-3 bacterium TaxID=2052148 RepID=A0A660SJ96_UNCW3|nr:MAG: DNA-directed RNA polymerase subunit beta' [candidate division WOR-3 bacterium]